MRATIDYRPQIKMDVCAVVCKALKEIDSLGKDEKDTWKADLAGYKEVIRLSGEVAEKDKTNTLVLIDKIDSGEEEGAQIELSKLCAPMMLEQMREPLKTKTFNMFIGKADGVDFFLLQK